MQAADAITQQSEEVAERQKRIGADQAEHVAEAAHKAADELQAEMPQAADLVREAASRLEKTADALRTRSLGELMGSFNDIGRKEPLALFGAAVVAGFAASRFLKSTADKSH